MNNEVRFFALEYVLRLISVRCMNDAVLDPQHKFRDPSRAHWIVVDEENGLHSMHVAVAITGMEVIPVRPSAIRLMLSRPHQRLEAAFEVGLRYQSVCRDAVRFAFVE